MGFVVALVTAVAAGVVMSRRHGNVHLPLSRRRVARASIFGIVGGLEAGALTFILLGALSWLAVVVGMSAAIVMFCDRLWAPATPATSELAVTPLEMTAGALMVSTAICLSLFLCFTEYGVRNSPRVPDALHPVAVQYKSHNFYPTIDELRRLELLRVLGFYPIPIVMGLCIFAVGERRSRSVAGVPEADAGR